MALRDEALQVPPRIPLPRDQEQNVMTRSPTGPDPAPSQQPHKPEAQSRKGVFVPPKLDTHIQKA